MPYIWDEHGWMVCVLYVACFSFLTFGLFNLIMATIVESTMQAGKRDDVKRRKERQKDNTDNARTVLELVRALCGEQDSEPLKAISDMFDASRNSLGIRTAVANTVCA